MKKTLLLSIVVCLFAAGIVSADTFGTGEKQFEIDFVNITSDASSANGTSITGYPAGHLNYIPFTDPGSFRLAKFEVTNDQWNKFENSLGVPITGNPSYAYNENSSTTGLDLPTDRVSWYEAAQFVNWLNTSTGHHEAYKFTNSQGTTDYRLGLWDVSDAWGGNNLNRHKDAFYFLPTEDEWVKAAAWNGTALQTYATTDNSAPVAGIDTNYDQDIPFSGTWVVGSGSEELNGTFDMMGNAGEWTESPYYPGEFQANPLVRGGAFNSRVGELGFRHRGYNEKYREYSGISFRVASVPEPATLSLLAFGGLLLRKRK